MVLHTLRFTAAFQYVLALLDALSGRYLVVREGLGTDNEHVHVFLDCESDSRAIRKRIQRSGHWTGNKAYSLKPCYDEQRWLQYICKGEGAAVAPDVVARQGFTEDQVKGYHEAYYIDQLGDARRKRKKLGPTTVVETVLEEARNSGLSWTDDEKIAEIYIREYTSAMKPYNEFHGLSVVRTVKVLLDPDGEALQNAVRSLVGRL